MSLDSDQRFHPDIDPSQVEGKKIDEKDLTRTTALKLARMGLLHEDETGERFLDAGSLAQTTEDQLIIQAGSGFGPKKAEELRRALERLMEE
jgi:hypothetical protein